jgi:hypothetical protein
MNAVSVAHFLKQQIEGLWREKDGEAGEGEVYKTLSLESLVLFFVTHCIYVVLPKGVEEWCMECGSALCFESFRRCSRWGVSLLRLPSLMKKKIY